MNDTIADMLTRIKNALMRMKDTVLVPNTKVNLEILRVLKEEDMIGEFSANEREVEVVLKYDGNEPVIRELQKVSKLGQRIYMGYKEIKPIMNGRGIAILSTSEGIMSGAMAKSKHLGGELICKVW